MDVVRFGLLGLGPGAMYALLALGLIVTYRGSRVLNLAHGAFAMVGAVTFMELRDLGLGSVPALLGGIVVSTLVAVVSFVFAVHPVRAGGSLVRLAATLGVLIVLQSGMLLRYGSDLLRTDPIFPTGAVDVPGDVSVGVDRLLLTLTAVVVTVVLWVLYRYSRFGIATTATAENPIAAAALGHSPKKVGIGNWVIGGALAGLAGALLMPITGVSATSMTGLVIVAFAAALLAGLKSFPLALVAGLGLGIAQSEVSRYASYPGFTDAVPLIVIAVVLTLRGVRHPERGDRADRFPAIGTGRIRVIPVLVVTVVLAVSAMTWMDAEWTDAFTTSTVMAIAALSLVVVTGYAGQISLAQMALAGMAAYVSGRAVAEMGWPFELAALVGVLAAAAVGALISLPALRVRTASLAVVTLALGLVLDVVIFGQTESFDVGTPSVFGIELSAIDDPGTYFVVALVVFVVLVVAVGALRRGRTGRRFIAVRSSERGAEALGINVAAVKISAFAIGGAIAGIAGILAVFRFYYVNFSTFGPFASISTLVFVLVGGIGFLAGPVIASFFASGGIVSPLTDMFGEDAQLWVAMAGGFILIANLAFAPDGLAKQFSDNAEKTRAVINRRRANAPEPESTRPSPLTRSDGVDAIPSARIANDPIPAQAAKPVRSAAKTSAALSVSGVTVSFGGVHALKNVSLQVAPGEIVGLVGPNGAGKTTLVDVISGFTRPDEGSVTLGDKDITSWPVYRRARIGLGRSFQGLETFEDMTVRENLLTAQEAVPGESREGIARMRLMFRRTKPALSDEATAALDVFKLAGNSGDRASTLSFGQRRLLGVARVIAARPGIVLLDEPAAGVSSEEAQELAHVLRLLAEHWGLGIVLIEHNVALIRSVCDRVVVLDKQVIAEGDPEEALAQEVVEEAFLGGSSARQTADGRDGAGVEITAGGRK